MYILYIYIYFSNTFYIPKIAAGDMGYAYISSVCFILNIVLAPHFSTTKCYRIKTNYFSLIIRLLYCFEKKIPSYLRLQQQQPTVTSTNKISPELHPACVCIAVMDSI